MVLVMLMTTLQMLAQVHVKGYTRKDGTYVQPHIRSNPDGNPYNNYSYPGNTNPYTGKVATGNESTYLSNNSNSSINNSRSWYNVPESTAPKFEDRVYVKDKNGNTVYTSYMVRTYKTDLCSEFMIYNAKDIPVAVVKYYDTEAFLYDLNNNLIKRSKYKKSRE